MRSVRTVQQTQGDAPVPGTQGTVRGRGEDKELTGRRILLFPFGLLVFGSRVFSLRSSRADGRGGERRPSRRRDEVQLPRSGVDVHPQLAVHADVPHPYLLHSLPLHPDHGALRVRLHLSDKVHPDAVQRAVAIHVHLQAGIHVHALVQQGVTVQFNAPHSSAGKPCAGDTRRTCKENGALPE